MHIPDLCPSIALYDLTLALVVFIFHGKLYVNGCSVELPARGVHAMNNLVLTKWHIPLSIYIQVLENHWKMVQVLRMITMSSECSTQWFMPFFRVCIVVIASAVIELLWQRKERRKSEGRRFAPFWWLAGLVLQWCFPAKKGSVAHGSTR